MGENTDIEFFGIQSFWGQLTKRLGACRNKVLTKVDKQQL
jgi:hypothetical protein